VISYSCNFLIIYNYVKLVEVAKVVEVVTLLIYIQDVLSYSLGWSTGYPKVLRGSPQSLYYPDYATTLAHHSKVTNHHIIWCYMI
jgi:hypothetical protein